MHFNTSNGVRLKMFLMLLFSSLLSSSGQNKELQPLFGNYCLFAIVMTILNS